MHRQVFNFKDSYFLICADMTNAPFVHVKPFVLLCKFLLLLQLISFRVIHLPAQFLTLAAPHAAFNSSGDSIYVRYRLLAFISRILAS